MSCVHLIQRGPVPGQNWYRVGGARGEPGAGPKHIPGGMNCTVCVGGSEGEGGGCEGRGGACDGCGCAEREREREGGREVERG